MVSGVLNYVDQTELNAALEQSSSGVNFNAVENQAAFSIAFSSVLFCWLAAKGISTIVNFVRR